MKYHHLKYYNKNRDVVIQRSKDRYQKVKNDPEFKFIQRTTHQKYYKKYNEKMKKMTVNLIRKSSQIYKKIIIDHYTKNTNNCMCCGIKFENIVFLTLDHVNNDGKKHRAELKKKGKFGHGLYFYKWIIDNKFPKFLQIICWNCNMAKSKNGGICPHKV